MITDTTSMIKITRMGVNEYRQKKIVCKLQSRFLNFCRPLQAIKNNFASLRIYKYYHAAVAFKGVVQMLEYVDCIISLASSLTKIIYLQVTRLENKY